MVGSLLARGAERDDADVGAASCRAARRPRRRARRRGGTCDPACRSSAGGSSARPSPSAESSQPGELRERAHVRPAPSDARPRGTRRAGAGRRPRRRPACAADEVGDDVARRLAHVRAAEIGAATARAVAARPSTTRPHGRRSTDVTVPVEDGLEVVAVSELDDRGRAWRRRRRTFEMRAERRAEAVVRRPDGELDLQRRRARASAAVRRLPSSVSAASGRPRLIRRPPRSRSGGARRRARGRARRRTRASPPRAPTRAVARARGARRAPCVAVSRGLPRRGDRSSRRLGLFRRGLRLRVLPRAHERLEALCSAEARERASARPSSARSDCTRARPAPARARARRHRIAARRATGRRQRVAAAGVRSRPVERRPRRARRVGRAVDDAASPPTRRRRARATRATRARATPSAELEGRAARAGASASATPPSARACCASAAASGGSAGATREPGIAVRTAGRSRAPSAAPGRLRHRLSRRAARSAPSGA